MAQLHIILCCNFLPAGTHSNGKLNRTSFREYSFIWNGKISQTKLFLLPCWLFAWEEWVYGTWFSVVAKCTCSLFCCKACYMSHMAVHTTTRLRNSHLPTLLTRLIFFQNSSIFRIRNVSCMTCTTNSASCIWPNLKMRSWVGNLLASILWEDIILIQSKIIGLFGDFCMYRISLCDWMVLSLPSLLKKNHLNSCDACKSMFRNSDSCSLL